MNSNLIKLISSSLALILLGGSVVNAEVKTLDARCNESFPARFKNCVCARSVPQSIQYSPSLEECDGKAAAILSGDYYNSYSVVLRDKENRDRWPVSGYNGCSFSLANSDSPPNACSVFKVQKKIYTDSSSVKEGRQVIHCFGEKGRHPLMKNATRLTIKLRDIPGSNADPLLRICLPKFDQNKALNN